MSSFVSVSANQSSGSKAGVSECLDEVCSSGKGWRWAMYVDRPKVDLSSLPSSVGEGSLVSLFVESMSNDLDLIEKALKSPKFKELREDLFQYVKAYKTKVIP